MPWDEKFRALCGMSGGETVYMPRGCPLLLLLITSPHRVFVVVVVVAAAAVALLIISVQVQRNYQGAGGSLGVGVEFCC